MKHIYICSCTEDGGIYHLVSDGGLPVIKDFVPLDRPTYAVISGGRLYAVLRETDKETGFGGVVSFAINGDGSLSDKSETVSSEGVVPCHLTVKDGRVYLVNYLSGNVVCPGYKKVAHEGQGVSLPRQEAPHTHFVNVSPDGKYLLCCDLGLDTVFTYDSDLNEVSRAKVPDGEGARHLAYSCDGKLVYCVNELGSSVSIFGYSDGVLTLKNTYKALGSYGGQNTAAAIRVKDGYVYVSNRGADTVTCFKAEGEELIKKSNIPCGGMSPRDMAFIGDYLLFANETTNSVTALKVRGEEAELLGFRAEIKHPICITVMEEND